MMENIVEGAMFKFGPNENQSEVQELSRQVKRDFD